jgi:hypothetical protein
MEGILIISPGVRDSRFAVRGGGRGLATEDKGGTVSKHNNVNPGQYKVAGRDKMGKPHGDQNGPKQAMARSRKQNGRGSKNKKG